MLLCKNVFTCAMILSTLFVIHLNYFKKKTDKFSEFTSSIERQEGADYKALLYRD